jgi:hypothetical protein
LGGNEGIWHTVMHEHASMTAQYLRRADLPAGARTLIGRARSRDTLTAAAYSIRRRQWRQFAFYARAGLRYDPLWTLKLIRHAAHRKRLRA